MGEPRQGWQEAFDAAGEASYRIAVLATEDSILEGHLRRIASAAGKDGDSIGALAMVVLPFLAVAAKEAYRQTRELRQSVLDHSMAV